MGDPRIEAECPKRFAAVREASVGSYGEDCVLREVGASFAATIDGELGVPKRRGRSSSSFIHPDDRLEGSIRTRRRARSRRPLWARFALRTLWTLRTLRAGGAGGAHGGRVVGAAGLENDVVVFFGRARNGIRPLRLRNASICDHGRAETVGFQVSRKSSVVTVTSARSFATS